VRGGQVRAAARRRVRRIDPESCDDVVIQGNTFDNPGGGSASISTGSEMSGGVWDVLAQDNTSGGTRRTPGRRRVQPRYP
jgi:polygalacturonase